MRTPYQEEFGLFVAMFVPGLLLGNLVLVVLSFFPVIHIVLRMFYRTPRRMKVEGGPQELDLWSGDRTNIPRKAIVEDGAGVVVLHQPAPTHVKVMAGPTTKVVWKGRGRLVVPLDRLVLFSRRGRYQLGRVGAGVIPAFPGDLRTFTTLGEEDRVMVSDRMLDMRRLRESRILERMPMPSRTLGSIGAETADFREIRRYVPGDRYRSINWKATARAGEGAVPMVNQYEAEGRLSVLILLDNGPSMAHSIGGSTALEHGVHAVQSLSSLYLASECEVGFYTFDDASPVYPRSGRRQGAMIGRRLMDLELAAENGDLEGAVRAFPDRLMSGALVIIITSLEQGNQNLVEDGLTKIRHRMGSRGRAILINIVGELPSSPPDVAALAAQVEGMRTAAYVRRMRTLGASVDCWNPREMSLSQFLIRRFGGDV